MNPLMQMMGGTPGGALGLNAKSVQQIRQMIGTLKSMQNPQVALQMVAQQNPQIAAVLQMCQGKNPQDVFYQQCGKYGIDPEQAMKQIYGVLNG